MLHLFEKSPAIQQIQDFLSSGKTILLEGLWNSPKAALAAIACRATQKNILFLTGASVEEVRLYHDFKIFTDTPVCDFPAWETLPSENIAPSPDIVGERYQTLNQIRASPTPHIIISSLQACLQKLIPCTTFEKLQFVCEVGKPLSYQATLDKLLSLGYQKKSMVSDKGEFAVRGAIIDLFPVSLPDPYRLEFWEDTLESMRTFDPIGQKSISPVNRLEILPGQELELLKKEQQFSSILDYLGEKTVIIFDDLLMLEDRYAALKPLIGQGPHFFSVEAFLSATDAFQKIYLPTQAIETLSEVTLQKTPKDYYSHKASPQELSFHLFQRKLHAYRLPSPFQPLQDALETEEEASADELLQAVQNLPKDSYQLHFLCEQRLDQENLQMRIADHQIRCPRHTFFHLGYLSSGFGVADIQTAIFPMTELTKRVKIRRQKQRSTYHTPSAEVAEFAVGDLVVHFNHGIGKFLGIEKKPNHEGILSEFFLIEYAENGKLFTPIQQSYLISKYIGAHEETPKLHLLGSARWKKTRDQTQSAIVGYASDLLNIYANREIQGGFSFAEDGKDTKNFEENFPFVETEDQLAAILSIKKDMVSTKAMDRLVCGDVGYGKTEVAMRAAFKAVLDGGKQVAVLVPTTVLAMQHGETFNERMDHFPIQVEVLSRFRTAKEIKETLQGLKNGTVDIVIGTHRIISSDVEFKNLGLIIIDEEQRFGVKAKEHLKKLKAGVDCLTLSATPIPRTLYMALVGAKDMSVISSPPQDRLPIKTVIAETDPGLIKNAILRELARDGQVYYIHNRVETIFEAANKLKELVPQARIVVGHGQMEADELDMVFHAFKKGDANILVATSIIENGIDIPNANTILVDRADRFGIADLYQIRGRVGRWNRRAYAYFLIPNQKTLPEISRKRLSALAEASGYGGGMKIAMRDLEIRGAGDLLGVEQSGHVASIGFHLYCKMLKKTIQILQGKLPKKLTDVKIEIPVDARLPESYIEEVALRLEFYQRFGEAVSLEEVDALFKEMGDRYGKAPIEARWLYHLARLKVFAERSGYTLIKKEKISFKVEKQLGNKIQSRTFLLPQFKNPEDVTKLMKAM